MLNSLSTFNQFIYDDFYFYIATGLIPVTAARQFVSPYYITGLVDAEGSFGLYLRKDPKYESGYQVSCKFAVELHLKDKALLEQIQWFFGGVGASPSITPTGGGGGRRGMHPALARYAIRNVTGRSSAY